MKRISAALAVVAAATYFAASVQAHSFRTGLIPNGKVIDGKGCINCHINRSHGGPRTSFGEAVLALVDPGSAAEFWDSTLAALDSDGDGLTNGDVYGGVKVQRVAAQKCGTC